MHDLPSLFCRGLGRRTRATVGAPLSASALISFWVWRSISIDLACFEYGQTGGGLEKPIISPPFLTLPCSPLGSLVRSKKKPTFRPIFFFHLLSLSSTLQPCAHMANTIYSISFLWFHSTQIKGKRPSLATTFHLLTPAALRMMRTMSNMMSHDSDMTNNL